MFWRWQPFIISFLLNMLNWSCLSFNFKVQAGICANYLIKIMKILHSLIISRSKIRSPILFLKNKGKATSLISKWIKLRTSKKSHSWHFTRWQRARLALVLTRANLLTQRACITKEWMNEWMKCHPAYFLQHTNHQFFTWSLHSLTTILTHHHMNLVLNI